ncbi:unnamed protein product [Symbiodinium natans]|uniref:WW domain-containing protein n=1 Tax=Symbiodinium natans TaxID=878477 RepID=A0A812P9N0_9DINO|nr:unnamed protein product [Symbiodinium natans]
MPSQKPFGVPPRDWYGNRGQGRVLRRQQGQRGPISPPAIIAARPRAPGTGTPLASSVAASPGPGTGTPLAAEPPAGSPGVAASSSVPPEMPVADAGLDQEMPVAADAVAGQVAAGADTAAGQEPGERQSPSETPPLPPFKWPFKKLAEVSQTEAMPFGWTKVLLQDNTCYCYNIKAKVCCWNAPTLLQVPDADPLPPGFSPWELWDVWGTCKTSRVWFNPKAGTVADFDLFKDAYESAKAEMEAAEMQRRRREQEARDEADAARAAAKKDKKEKKRRRG